MTLNEIANDILRQENNQLAQAFTMCIGSLLLSKGIQPVIEKSCEEWNANDDLNKYIIRKEYNATFDIDTTEHDKQIRADAIEECIKLVKDSIRSEDACTMGWIVSGLEQLKEQKNEVC